jgi:hypothetical protein
LVVIILSALMGNPDAGYYVLLGIPGLLLGCVLFYQLQRLTWYCDCRPDATFSDPAAIILGILFAALGALMMYQATWAIELVVRMKTEWYFQPKLKGYVIGISFVQGLIIFIWMGLKLKRYQYFLSVLGFHLVGHVLLALCLPLSYWKGFHPYITGVDQLGMVGILGLIALAGFLAWGFAPMLYLNSFRLYQKQHRLSNLNIE